MTTNRTAIVTGGSVVTVISLLLVLLIVVLISPACDLGCVSAVTDLTFSLLHSLTPDRRCPTTPSKCASALPLNRRALQLTRSAKAF